MFVGGEKLKIKKTQYCWLAAYVGGTMSREIRVAPQREIQFATTNDFVVPKSLFSFIVRRVMKMPTLRLTTNRRRLQRRLP